MKGRFEHSHLTMTYIQFCKSNLKPHIISLPRSLFSSQIHYIVPAMPDGSNISVLYDVRLSSPILQPTCLTLFLEIQPSVDRQPFITASCTIANLQPNLKINHKFLAFKNASAGQLSMCVNQAASQRIEETF